MKRQVLRIVLVCSTLLFSWLAMMVVHEFGHVLHAWVSGGTVTGVVLHPFAISRTDIDPNPHPLFVAWGGAVWGILIPLLLLWIAHLLCPKFEFLFAFFAGFCLIANGTYLGVGFLYPVGDASDLVKHGTPAWILLVFGIVATVPGIWLWNGLGEHFGLSRQRKDVDPRATFAVCVALAVLVGLELILP